MRNDQHMMNHPAPRLRARLCIATFDFAACALVATLLSFAFTQPAWAYVDPSVMTYTIQALAGVAVALSAVAGVAMRRTRKALFKALNIDVNRNKEVEADVCRIDPDTGRPVKGGAVGATAQMPRKAPGKARDRGYAPGWKVRIPLALATSTFFVFTLFVVAPYEIVAASAGSVFFSLNDVWQPIAMVAAAMVAVLALLLSLLRGRAFNLALLLVFGIGLGCYAQALFLNGGLPPSDGHSITWNDYRRPMVVSGIVWLILIIGPLQLSKVNRQRTQLGAAALSLALVIVQGVGVGSLFANAATAGTSGDKAVVTEQGLYDVSSKKNVVVFVLDTYDTQFLQSTLQAAPDLLDDFKGFTWYRDSLGSMIPTRYGLSFLLHGQYPQPDEDFGTYLNQRYKRAHFLQDVQNLNFSTGIYTDTLGTQFLSDEEANNLVNSKTINVHPASNTITSWNSTLKALAKCAFYRDMPWMLKPFFWFYTDEINQATNADNPDIDPANKPYIMNDAGYYNSLKQRGLTIQENDEQYDGAFRFIHMTGTHWPYNLDENGNDIGLHNANLTQQARGCMKPVQHYINQLKEMGVYDNTTIIITADHGDWYLTENPLEKVTVPYMLVKPAQSAELDSQPYKVSQAPVAAEDVLPTCIKYMGGDYSTYPGYSMDEIPEGLQRPRFFNMTLDRDAKDYKIIQYEVNGDSLDFANWKLTGVSWDVGEGSKAKGDHD
ncbi:MAG: sulfatase-like hydrolase/transferase [Berryella intestinalis]|uniref:sulfatase-like hydrolase/transferase n=1 Tax=Berryella intestinalis TaxID=1531429 RepID=UPI002A5551B7|nr:sulfatase-like hydrolase/transferase [Berryella intestinalis]MDD7369088.1 sulfatase-like hydrolase/transferase [Berryella intestinalis]MDY3129291.1 sulfatase-like hydrolase/transferase [Berryella intestinalis]